MRLVAGHMEGPSQGTPVTHSSTGKHAHILLIPVAGFIQLSNLALEWLPESMKYKLSLLEQTCPVCGKVFPKQGHSLSCSESCQKEYWKIRGHEYYEAHKDLQRDQRKAYAEQYRETHREEIRAKSRQKYAELSPEERRVQNQKVAACQKKKEEYYRQTAHERYLKRKSDPVEWEKYLAGRKAYKEAVKADPERYARLKERQRLASQRKRERKKALQQQAVSATTE